MRVDEHKDAAAEGWDWVSQNVIGPLGRPFKFTWMGLAATGAFGHMGRTLIEGIEWWVVIVEIYQWIMYPVADVLEKVLQAPILYVASWFDISLTLPAFPTWGIDFIVLANIAAGFLVFRRFLSIPAQLFIALTIIVSLGVLVYSIELYSAYGLIVSAAMLAAGLYCVYVALLAEVYFIAWMNSDLSVVVDGGHSPRILSQSSLQFAGMRDVLSILWKFGSRPMKILSYEYKAYEDGYTRAAMYLVVLTHSAVIALGAMALSLNKYADVYLPPLERLATAWDAMFQDWLSVFGL